MKNPVEMYAGAHMSPAEAAEYLRVDIQNIYKQLQRGKLPAVKVGIQWRIKAEALDKLFRLPEDNQQGDR